MTDLLAQALAAPLTGTGTPLQMMRSRRKSVHNAMTAMLNGVVGDQRDLHASEQRSFDRGKAAIAEIDVRIGELEVEETRSAAAAETRRLTGGSESSGWSVTGGGETYHRGESSPSFFRDLIHAQRGDADAADRLRRNNQEQNLEKRALGNTGATGGSGGEFAPPGYLVQDWIALARPGRVTADLFHHEQMPAGVSQVLLPRVLTGTTTSIQTTQNTALSQTDLTTGSLSSGISTIGGKQVVSQQLLDQSAIPFDKVVLEDLTADFARQLGTQVLTGTGASGQLRGYLTPASTSIQTWTQATPTGPGFYAQLAALQAKIIAARYLSPDKIVMHPRRWAWFASAVDTQNRPLVLPTGEAAFNAMGTSDRSVAQGSVGTVLGMDVFIDPNIAINTGAGTNQDTVLMFRGDDIWFWESDLRAEAFTQPYADSMGVLFRVYNYSALVPDRYLASLGQLVGTGLVTPVFAS